MSADLTPPANLGPVQGAYLLIGTVPDDALAYSLVHAAALGVVELAYPDKGHWMVNVVPTTRVEAADPVTRVAVESLPADGLDLHRKLTVGDQARATGAAIRAAGDAVTKATRAWALDEGYLQRSWGRRRPTDIGRTRATEVVGFRDMLDGSGREPAELERVLAWAMSLDATSPFLRIWEASAGMQAMPAYLTGLGNIRDLKTFTDSFPAALSRHVKKTRRGSATVTGDSFAWH